MASDPDAITTLALDSRSLPAAVEMQPYAFTLRPRGGAPPYFFSALQQSTLPAELVLSTAGVLAGATARVGQFSFEVTVTDSGHPAQTDRATYELRVLPLLRAASQSSLTDARQGVEYSEALVATGGVRPHAFEVESGALPAGIELSPNGTLRGRPSQSGTSTFIVSVTDSGEPRQRDQRELTMAVKLLGPTLEIATQSLADGRVGWEYRQPLRAFGGSSPYSWSVSGALPPGIRLEDASSVGVLAGTPTQSGLFRVTITVTDAVSLSAQKELWIRVF